MSEFHRTSMGRKYYESDLPKLTKVLEKIADQLEKSNKLEEKKLQNKCLTFVIFAKNKTSTEIPQGN